MKRYIVFERPEGSKCWTMAIRENGVPMSFCENDLAELAAQDVRDKHRGWLSGLTDQTTMTACVVSVDLPE